MQRKLNGLLTLSQVATYLDQISDKLEYNEDSESCLIWKDSGKRAGTKSHFVVDDWFEFEELWMKGGLDEKRN